MSKLFRRFWCIADTHLGHDKMVELCNRPVDFSSRILHQLNLNVKENDIFICFGDICLYDIDHWHDQLNIALPRCYRWLIRGNHDKKTISWYLDHGWDWVGDRMDVQMYGCRIALSHRPLAVDDSFDINVHGHLHITNHHPECEVSSKHRLICCEPTYTPVLLKTIIGK